eukprot:TRINITY_DN318_c0_g1_i7.p1 TRINITY_DN318_c0_g1~~TRINITY_DN318_c0_g1_i7.p1  ORF type:complete len:1629 (+),score=203.29 TRINITY_DN318_c0_g1_i7:108-4994(+)
MDSNKLASELLQMYDNLSLEIVVAELSIAARLERDLEYVHQMLHLKNRIVQINPGLYRRADGTAVPMAADGSMTAADVIWEKIRVAHRRFPGLHAELVEDTIIQNYPDTTEANAVFALCSDHVRDCVGGGEARARRDPRQAHRCEGAEIDAFIEIMRQETGSSVRDIRELVDQYWPERDTIRVMLRTAPAPAAVSEVAQATAAASEVAAAAPAVEPHVAASASVSVGAPAQTAAKRSHTASAAPARAPAQVSTGAPVVDAALRSNTTAALRSHTTAVGQLHSPPPPPPGPKHTVTVPGGQPHSPPPPPPVGQPHSPPPPPPATPPVLQLWRGYHCGRCLGSGTFGDVYEATDNKEEAERGEFPYALKTFRCGNAKQLEREYICCQRVWGHPNFVEFVQRLDPLSGEKFPRLLMRRARGGSLEELLRQNPHQPVPVTLRRAMVRQLLSAVRYMHRLQIVHRDIRPANLLLQEAIDFSAVDCVLLVCDFGESTLDPSMTKRGGSVGTVLYCPPMVHWSDEKADLFSWADARVDSYAWADARVDSYACGVIMYRLATGYVPFGSAAYGGFAKNSEQRTEGAVNRAKLADRYDTDVLTDPEERSVITSYIRADPTKRAFVRCPEDLDREMRKDWQRRIVPMCLEYIKVKVSADHKRWMFDGFEGQLSPQFRLAGELSFLLRAPAAAETVAWAAPCPMADFRQCPFALGGVVLFGPGGMIVQAAHLRPVDDHSLGTVPLNFEDAAPWNSDLQCKLLSSVGSISGPGGAGRWQTVPEEVNIISGARTDQKYWFSWLYPEEKLVNHATGVSYTAPECGALVIGDRGREGLFNNSPTVFELRAATVSEMIQQQEQHIVTTDCEGLLAEHHRVLSEHLRRFSELATQAHRVRNGDDIRECLNVTEGLDYLDEPKQRSAWLQTVQDVFGPSRELFPVFLSSGVLAADRCGWMSMGIPVSVLVPAVTTAVADVLRETKLTTLSDRRLARWLLANLAPRPAGLPMHCGAGPDEPIKDEDWELLDAFDLHFLQQPSAKTGEKLWNSAAIRKVLQMLQPGRGGKREESRKKCIGIRGAEILLRYWAASCPDCAAEARQAEPCEKCAALAFDLFCGDRGDLRHGDVSLWPGLEGDGQIAYIDALLGMPAALSLLGVTGLHTGFTAPFARQVARDWLRRAPSSVLTEFMPQLLQAVETLHGATDGCLRDILIGDERMERSDLRYCSALFWGQIVSAESARHGFAYDDIQRQLSVEVSNVLREQRSFVDYLKGVASECKKSTTAEQATRELQNTLRGCERLQTVGIADVDSEEDHGDSTRVTLPLYHESPLWAIAVDQCCVFKSSTKPLKLAFRMSGRADICGIVFKDGDDLRRDQVVTQLVRIVADMYAADTGGDLHLTGYEVAPTSPTSGMMEFVPSTKLQTFIRRECDDSENELMDLARIADGKPRKRAAGEPEPTAEEVEREKREDKKKLNRYIASNAGYAAISYILGFGDRHLENLMLSPNGRLFHIDFGFILGQDPKLSIPLKLRKEMIDAMGGESSPHFRVFRSFVSAVFVIMREQAGLFLSVLHAMKHVRGKDSSYMLMDTKSFDVVCEALKGVEKRLFLDVPESAVSRKVDAVIDEALYGFSAQAGALIDAAHGRF